MQGSGQHHSLRTNELQNPFARFTQKNHILLVRGCCAAPGGEPSLAFCDGLWRDGVGGGGEERGGGDVCIMMADLHCCMAETDTTL